jgi:hypothetical protein
MMTVEAFEHSLSNAAPPGEASLAMQALWWAGKGEWDRAHHCAQQGEGQPDCDLVHAYLHRQEGDIANARYWYRRVGRSLPAGSLQEEWKAVAAHLLSRG